MAGGAGLRVLARGEVLALAGLLIVAAVAGNQICGLAVLERRLDRLSIGLGMIPRGEVGLIVADAGRRLVIGGRPVIDDAIFSSVIVVVLATTLLGPVLLKWSLGRRPIAI